MTLPESTPTPRLDITLAVQDGWRAFRRAPWVFTGYALLVGVLQLLCNALQNLAGTPDQPSTNPGLLLLALLGAVAGVVVNLWAITGLVRGSWCALEGRAPDFGTFLRWDGAALVRLLLPQLALSLAVLGGLVVAAVIPAIVLPAALATDGGVLRAVLVSVGLAALIAGMAFLLYFVVSQFFLPQIALVEGPGPLRALQRGQQVVIPQWGQVLLLSLVETLLLLLGLLACIVGLVAAVPVVVAISTAAYRQLFGTTMRTTLLTAGEPSV